MSNGGWNYRVIVKHSEHHVNRGELYFEVHQCHYDKREDTLPTSWSKTAIAAMGHDEVDSLLDDLTMMVEALNKPILIERDGKLEEWVKPDEHS